MKSSRLTGFQHFTPYPSVVEALQAYGSAKDPTFLEKVTESVYANYNDRVKAVEALEEAEAKIGSLQMRRRVRPSVRP